MADLSVDFAGIKSPNPFWLASAPPTNMGSMVERAFDAGWGGAVWKTLGEPIRNVCSRLAAVDMGPQRMMGLNNIELITDRPLEVNLREIRECKRKYPKHAVIVSLMVESKREAWHEIVKRAEDTGCDGFELNFGCPHGMSERGMGAAMGQVPDYTCMVTEWVKEAATHPRHRQAHAQRDEHQPARARGRARRRRRPLAHQHHQLRDGRQPRHARPAPERQRHGGARRLLRPGGQAHRAQHGLGAGARPRSQRARSRASAASRRGATRPSSSRSARRTCRSARPSCTTATASSRT